MSRSISTPGSDKQHHFERNNTDFVILPRTLEPIDRAETASGSSRDESRTRSPSIRARPSKRAATTSKAETAQAGTAGLHFATRRRKLPQQQRATPRCQGITYPAEMVLRPEPEPCRSLIAALEKHDLPAGRHASPGEPALYHGRQPFKYFSKTATMSNTKLRPPADRPSED